MWASSRLLTQEKSNKENLMYRVAKFLTLFYLFFAKYVMHKKAGIFNSKVISSSRTGRSAHKIDSFKLMLKLLRTGSISQL